MHHLPMSSNTSRWLPGASSSSDNGSVYNPGSATPLPKPGAAAPPASMSQAEAGTPGTGAGAGALAATAFEDCRGDDDLPAKPFHLELSRRANPLTREVTESFQPPPPLLLPPPLPESSSSPPLAPPRALAFLRFALADALALALRASRCMRCIAAAYARRASREAAAPSSSGVKSGAAAIAGSPPSNAKPDCASPLVSPMMNMPGDSPSSSPVVGDARAVWSALRVRGRCRGTDRLAARRWLPAPRVDDAAAAAAAFTSNVAPSLPPHRYRSV